MPTLPLASMMKGVVSGEVVSSTRKLGPLPVLVTESLAQGEGVPTPSSPPVLYPSTVSTGSLKPEWPYKINLPFPSPCPAPVEDHDHIIDAPARASGGTLEIANHADLVVQPSGATIDDLDPAIILFHELVRAGVPRERLMMALCRIGTVAEESAARGYIEKAGYAVLPGSIPERAEYRDAQNHGRAVTEMKELNARTDALMEGLLARIGETVKAKVQAAGSGRKNRGRA
jgi:hypothetical protein